MKKISILLFAGWYLAGWLAGILPLSAEPTRIDLLVEGTEEIDGVATLTAIPVMGPAAGNPPEAIATEVDLPGNVTLDLAPGFTWRLHAKAEGFWGAEILVGGPGSQGGTLRLVPTATLAADLKIRPGAKEPSKLGVRFRLAKGATAGLHAASEAMIECPIEVGRWSCEVPSGTLDLRLHTEGFIAHYFWDRVIAPGVTHPLGALELISGASISGWLKTDDRSPLKPGTSVASVHQTTAAEDPVELRQRRGLAKRVEVTDRGFFHFASGLAPGAYHLEAEQEGFTPLKSLPVVVTEGAETELAEPLVLTRPAELRIAVDPQVDGLGEPWSLLLLADGTPTPAGAGRTGLDGAWIASDLKPGAYYLTVSDSEGSRVRFEEILVEAGSTEHWVDLELIAVEGRVSLGAEPL